jgi:hypothetical protein
MMGTCLMQANELARAEQFMRTACELYRKMQMIPYLRRWLQSCSPDKKSADHATPRTAWRRKTIWIR